MAVLAFVLRALRWTGERMPEKWRIEAGKASLIDSIDDATLV